MKSYCEFCPNNGGYCAVCGGQDKNTRNIAYYMMIACVILILAAVIVGIIL